MSPILVVLLNTNCKSWCSVINTNFHPTSFITPCKSWGIEVLHCCNYCHLPSDFSFKFESSMTIFHHKLLTRKGRVLADGWTHPSSMIIFVHLFIRKCHLKSYQIDINYHMTLNSILYSVVPVELNFRFWDNMIGFWDSNTLCFLALE